MSLKLKSALSVFLLVSVVSLAPAQAKKKRAASKSARRPAVVAAKPAANNPAIASSAVEVRVRGDEALYRKVSGLVEKLKKQPRMADLQISLIRAAPPMHSVMITFKGAPLPNGFAFAEVTYETLDEDAFIDCFRILQAKTGMAHNVAGKNGDAYAAALGKAMTDINGKNIYALLIPSDLELQNRIYRAIAQLQDDPGAAAMKFKTFPFTYTGSAQEKPGALSLQGGRLASIPFDLEEPDKFIRALLQHRKGLAGATTPADAVRPSSLE